MTGSFIIRAQEAVPLHVCMPFIIDTVFNTPSFSISPIDSINPVLSAIFLLFLASFCWQIHLYLIFRVNSADVLMDALIVFFIDTYYAV